MFGSAGAYYVLLAILLFFVASVVYADLRSRRGWGLTLMALALFCYGVFMAYLLAWLRQNPTAGDLAGAFVLAVYFGIYLALTLIVWIGALVEAGVARHWGWFVGLFAATLVPAMFVLALVTLKLGAPVLSAIGSTLYFGLILAPPLIMLAYGIARIARPVPLQMV